MKNNTYLKKYVWSVSVLLTGVKNGKKHGTRLNIVAKVAERTNEKYSLNISTSTISRISTI